MSKDWSRHRTGTEAWDFLHTFLMNESVTLKEASHDWYDKPVILTLELSWEEKKGIEACQAAERERKKKTPTMNDCRLSHMKPATWLDSSICLNNVFLAFTHTSLNSLHGTFSVQTRNLCPPVLSICWCRNLYFYLFIGG